MFLIDYFVHLKPFTYLGKKVDRHIRRRERSEFIKNDKQDPYFILRRNIDKNISTYSKYADKFMLKKLVSNIVKTPEVYAYTDGKRIIINKNFKPGSKAVIKSNLGAGWFKIIETNEITPKLIKKYYKKFRSSKFSGLMNGENQYANSKYILFIEEYVADHPLDYKIHLLNNDKIIYSIFSSSDRSIRKIVNEKFEMIQAIDSNDNINIKITKDEKKILINMKEIAEKLKAMIGDNYARYDFYYENGNIYLGEITFSHGSGRFFKQKHNHSEEDIRDFVNGI